ncbi:YraN family protein [soil metagenome]
MAEHNDLGFLGEEIAREFLEDKGYLILAQNWKFHRKEIDLVALHNGFLIIVEVKTRSSAVFGYPDDFIGIQKINFLAEAACAYADKLDNDDLEIRFDVISVTFKNKVPAIYHQEGAFHP